MNWFCVGSESESDLNEGVSDSENKGEDHHVLTLVSTSGRRIKPVIKMDL